MKIDRAVHVELTHEDIEQAIRNYIAAQVPGISDFKLDIFDARAPRTAGEGFVPLCNLNAEAEIELITQPAYRAEVTGDKNPLPIKDTEFKRQFADAKPLDGGLRITPR